MFLRPSKVWAMFLLFLIFSAIGVAISFDVFGSTITGFEQWEIGLVISVLMLGISYGAKYANANARQSFTPMDFIQYLSQGLLWPTTWPALAEMLGVKTVTPPHGLDRIGTAISTLFSYHVHRVSRGAATGTAA